MRSASHHQQIAGIDLLVTVELRLSNVAGRQFDSEDSASTPPTSSTCPDTTAGNCCALFCAPLRRISPGIHGSDPTACPSFPVSTACCFPQPVVLHLTSTQSPMSHCSADISLCHEVLQQCCDSAATVLCQQRPASSCSTIKFENYPAAVVSQWGQEAARRCAPARRRCARQRPPHHQVRRRRVCLQRLSPLAGKRLFAARAPALDAAASRQRLPH